MKIRFIHENFDREFSDVPDAELRKEMLAAFESQQALEVKRASEEDQTGSLDTKAIKAASKFTGESEEEIKRRHESINRLDNKIFGEMKALFKGKEDAFFSDSAIQMAESGAPFVVASLYKFWRGERKIKRFHVSDSLLDALNDTDLPDSFTLSQSLKLPAPQCVIRWGSTRRETYIISGDVANQTMLFMCGMTQAQQDLIQSKMRETHPTITFDRLREQIKGMWCDFDSDGLAHGNLTYIRADDATKAMAKVQRQVINFLLYMCSSEADVEYVEQGGKKMELAENRKQRMQSDRFYSYFEVGRRTIYVGESRHTDRKLSVRFLVRGHWRNQAAGKGLAERKLIWIKPYWKGPEQGEVLTNVVRVVRGGEMS